MTINSQKKIHENEHSDRNIDYKIKRQKTIEQKLSCDFIRTNSGKKDFDIFKAITEVLMHMKQSSNKPDYKKLIAKKILLKKYHPIFFDI